MPTTNHSEAAKRSIISTGAYTSVVNGMYAFVNKAVSINWRASLVPAAAVIPAPVAYANVVDVKKLVVDCIFFSLSRQRVFFVGAEKKTICWKRFPDPVCFITAERKGRRY